MRNIFLFIRRYFNFLLFLLLQVISITLIVRYSKTHHAIFGNISNTVTGKINTRYSSVQQYFHLKRTNDSLLKANELLYNKLKSNYALPDSTDKAVIDSIKVDSIIQFRKFTYLGARVVSNSVSAPNNFIVLARGRNGGLREGMGVVDPNNHVVGIITEVTGDYAVVMSLLHKDSKLQGKLFKSGETGILNWDGAEPNMLSLTNIPKTATINKGDSIVTWFSTMFPKGLLIGKVEAVYKEKSSNYFRVSFKTAANFYNLQYAYVIENPDQEPVRELLEKYKNK